MDKVEFIGWAGAIDGKDLIIGVSPNDTVKDGLVRVTLDRADRWKMYCKRVKVIIEVEEDDVESPQTQNVLPRV